MGHLKKLTLIFALLSVALSVCSQDKLEPTVGADIVSSYIYRGNKLANFSLQPYIGLSWKNFYLEAWASTALDQTQKYESSQYEFDITLTYDYKDYHFGITDYYNFNCGCPYFKYDGREETAHMFEANVGYNYKWLTVDWSTVFAGYDGVNSNGHRAYSSYLKLQADWQWLKLLWNAELGIVPYCTDLYYDDNSDGFHINDIALKVGYPIPLGRKFELPVYTQVVANPSNSNFFFMIGCNLEIF